MSELDREEFKKKMIRFREKLLTSAKKKKQHLEYDGFMSEAYFQELLIQKFYRSYMLKVAKDNRKFIEDPEKFMDRCFYAAASIFKVQFNIYEWREKNKELKCVKTVEMKGSKSQPSKIYLLYYKQVFIQLNPAVQRTVINERAEEGEGHE